MIGAQNDFVVCVCRVPISRSRTNFYANDTSCFLDEAGIVRRGQVMLAQGVTQSSKKGPIHTQHALIFSLGHCELTNSPRAAF